MTFERYIDELEKTAGVAQKRHESLLGLAKVAGVSLGNTCSECSGPMTKTGSIMRCSCGMMKKTEAAQSKPLQKESLAKLGGLPEALLKLKLRQELYEKQKHASHPGLAKEATPSPQRIANAVRGAAPSRLQAFAHRMGAKNTSKFPFNRTGWNGSGPSEYAKRLSERELDFAARHAKNKTAAHPGLLGTALMNAMDVPEHEKVIQHSTDSLGSRVKHIAVYAPGVLPVGHTYKGLRAEILPNMDVTPTVGIGRAGVQFGMRIKKPVEGVPVDSAVGKALKAKGNGPGGVTEKLAALGWGGAALAGGLAGGAGGAAFSKDDRAKGALKGALGGAAAGLAGKGLGALLKGAPAAAPAATAAVPEAASALPGIMQAKALTPELVQAAKAEGQARALQQAADPAIQSLAKGQAPGAQRLMEATIAQRKAAALPEASSIILPGAKPNPNARIVMSKLGGLLKKARTYFNQQHPRA